MQVGSIETVVRALNDNKIRYLIVGRLAVNAHGYERMTRDLDLVISLEFENIVRALEALIAIGYQPSVPVTPPPASLPTKNSVIPGETRNEALERRSSPHTDRRIRPCAVRFRH